MNNQLSNVSIQFRKFLKGQYISDPEQFNEFLDFFEDQDRLSRVMLQGVGIVCGFVPERVYPQTRRKLLDNFLQPKLLLEQRNQLPAKIELQPLQRDINFLQRDEFLQGDIKIVLNSKAQLVKNKASLIDKTQLLDKAPLINKASLINKAPLINDKVQIVNDRSQFVKNNALLVKNEALFPQNIVKLSKADVLLAQRNIEFVQKEPLFLEGGISLSQGVAITTDGDLLTLDIPGKETKDLNVSNLRNIDVHHKLYTRYKVYNNHKSEYPAFYKSGVQIPLWELATIDEAGKDFAPLDKLVDINNMYLLLYLESYEKPIQPCHGIDCDNYGVQQVRNLKVLLTTEDGIKQIVANDKIYREPGISGLVVDKKMERIMLNDSIDSAADLNAAYRSAIMTQISTATLNPMFVNMGTIANLMGVQPVHIADFIEDITSYIDDTANIQYCYDVIKDLIDTYSEIIELLPKAFTATLPDLLSFPKHIMLGRVTANTNTKLKQKRHDFYNSPVLDNEKTTEKVRLLTKRFYQQISTFNIPEPATVEDIRITPSRAYGKLGDEAVAFYYTMSEDLLKTWNFRKTGNRAYKTNLGYKNPFITDNPFNNILGAKSFFRIEGLHGLNCDEAVNKIIEIRGAAGISFDIMKLSLEELSNNTDSKRANFNEYLRRNPGLEHKAGVEAKGTFCVVYESHANPVIIADFSLPYICCTPKSEVSLSLPATSICEGSRRIPFTVSPLNGVVEANVTQGNGGVIFSNGQYYFDPSQVSESLRNKDISFTVNGKPTECTIKVVTLSDVKVLVGDVALPQAGKNVTTVTFKVVGSNFGDYDYKWDFFGKGSYVDFIPDADGIVAYKYPNFDTSHPPVVNVQVSGNGCVQYITLRDWYHPPTLILKIDSITFPTSYCCGDPSGTGEASAAMYGNL